MLKWKPPPCNEVWWNAAAMPCGCELAAGHDEGWQRRQPAGETPGRTWSPSTAPPPHYWAHATSPGVLLAPANDPSVGQRLQSQSQNNSPPHHTITQTFRLIQQPCFCELGLEGGGNCQSCVGSMRFVMFIGLSKQWPDLLKSSQTINQTNAIFTTAKL